MNKYMHCIITFIQNQTGKGKFVDSDGALLNDGWGIVTNVYRFFLQCYKTKSDCDDGFKILSYLNNIYLKSVNYGL